MDSDKLKLIVGVATSHITVCKHPAEIGSSPGRQKKAEPRPGGALSVSKSKFMPLVLLRACGNFGVAFWGWGVWETGKVDVLRHSEVHMLWGGGRLGFLGIGELSDEHRNSDGSWASCRVCLAVESQALCCGAAGLRDGVCEWTKTLSSKDHLSTDKDNGLKAKKRGFDWSRKSCTRH